MARIAGINIPAHKHVWVGLTSIFGIGQTRARLVCENAGVPLDTKPGELSVSVGNQKKTITIFY